MPPSGDAPNELPEAGVRSGGAPGARHERILLVEDEAPLRVGTTRLLVEHGYTVLAAADGAEAFEFFEQASCDFDVVVTDMVMPRMRGDELARRVCDKNPVVRVIFTSGYDFGDRPPLGRLLSKPVAADTLLRAIREALDA